MEGTNSVAILEAPEQSQKDVQRAKRRREEKQEMKKKQAEEKNNAQHPRKELVNPEKKKQSEAEVAAVDKQFNAEGSAPTAKDPNMRLA